MKVTALMSINRRIGSRFCKSSSLLQSWMVWRERVFVYLWFWPCPTTHGPLLARSKPKVESSTRKTRCCVSGHQQTAGRWVSAPSIPSLHGPRLLLGSSQPARGVSIRAGSVPELAAVLASFFQLP